MKPIQKTSGSTRVFVSSDGRSYLRRIVNGVPERYRWEDGRYVRVKEGEWV
jgi:hypothetical protein